MYFYCCVSLFNYIEHFTYQGQKNQDFMLIRLFNSIDLIGCGGDINQ